MAPFPSPSICYLWSGVYETGVGAGVRAVDSHRQITAEIASSALLEMACFTFSHSQSMS